MTNENRQTGNSVLPDNLENLVFDDWKLLHEQNPEKFDEYRKIMLEHQIELAPEKSRQRLRGLLFQMEGEAARAKTPLSHAMRLSAMMMDMFEELRSQLQIFCNNPSEAINRNKQVPPSAKIISFKQTRKDET